MDLLSVSFTIPASAEHVRTVVERSAGLESLIWVVSSFESDIFDDITRANKSLNVFLISLQTETRIDETTRMLRALKGHRNLKMVNIGSPLPELAAVALADACVPFRAWGTCVEIFGNVYLA